MMQPINMALCQGHWTGEQESTIALYTDLIAEAVAQDATLICLPEFTLLPYFPGIENNPESTRWQERRGVGVSHDFFSAMAKQHAVTLIGSIFEEADDGLWDTAVIYNPQGALSHYTRKVHIPQGTGYHETEYFNGYGEFPVHDIGLANIAAPTCYDQWFPELARIYALNGADVIYYPTAIGSEPDAPDFDSAQAWQTIMRGHAVANGVFIGACNRVGHENAVTFYGSSFVCDPLGNVLVQASRDRDEVVMATLDPNVQAQYRSLFPLLKQRQPQHYGRLTQADD
ncbi:MAG: nitrilase-related carbon-nitrogen hydrolase [Chloroflexota bacterium]